MDVFFLVFQQLMMMAILILIGYFLKKKNLVPDNTAIALSKLELYVLVPAISFGTQLQYCTIENFTQNSSLILYGGVIVAIAVLLSYPLSSMFIRNASKSSELEYKRNIYKYALTFSNHGFIGNFLVLGIWGPEALFLYMMFVFIVGLVTQSWGLSILIPKGQGSVKENLKKSLLAPPIVALVLGMICGLLNVRPYVPNFAISALDNLSNCMGPVAMVLAGLTIGEYDVKKLVSNVRVYVATALRLIIIPGVFLLALRWIGASEMVMRFTLVAFGGPLGMNTIVFPAAYGGETETGASMAVISNVIALVTIPLMYYLFFVVL